MANAISRRWRSRGHGIHSPKVYRLVRWVLCDSGSEYYAYEDYIDTSARSWRERKRARRFYRFVAAINPGEVSLRGCFSRAEMEALKEPSTGRSGVRLTVEEKGGRYELTVRDANEPTEELVEIEGNGEVYRVYFRGASCRRYSVRMR